MPQPSFIFSLKIEPCAGTSIEDCSRDAQRLADQLGVCVEFDFNGVSCNARPGGQHHQLAVSAMNVMGTNSKHRIAFS